MNLLSPLGKLFGFICLGLSISPLWGQPVSTPEPRFWMPNGPINAILVTNDTVYIGGDFSYVGPRTGPAVVFDETSGQLLAAPPRIGGFLKAVVSDGAGGWFVGGSFTNIGNVAITNVAHLGPDLSLDVRWSARLNGTVVNALAFDNNGRLYVGGSFSRIGGQTIQGLAGLSTTDASVNWNPQLSGGVNTMALVGNLLYVGGSFFNVGPSNSQYLAAIATDTTLATGWPTVPGAPDQQILTLAVSGSTVYVGGNFTTVGTKPRNRLAALDATTGIASPWNPNPNGIVRALAVSGSSVYVGGDFTTIGGKSRNGFGAVSPGNGAAQTLDLQIQTAISQANFIRSILLDGNSLYVGGQFTYALGAFHPLVVGVDVTSSTTLPVPLGSDFNGSFGTAYGPNAMALANGALFVAGDFQSIGGVARQGAAALSLSSGAALTWAPAFTGGPVMSLAYGTNRVYVGGSFTNVNATNFVNGLAAIDPIQGRSIPSFYFHGTNTFGSVSVNALGGRPGMVFVGGTFVTVDGQTRRLLAAIDPSSGALVSGFNANLGGGGFSGGVSSLALAGNTLFVGGDFSTVNSASVAKLAALSATNGSALNWTPPPNPNQAVNTLAVTSDSLYVGGNFAQIGGVAFRNFAGFSVTDFSSLGIDAALPTFAGGVNAIAATETTLYVAGSFSAIGGNFIQNLGCLASFNASAYDWNPSPDQPPTTIALTDDFAFVGGPFRFLGQSPTNQVWGFFAAFQRGPAVLSTSVTASKSLQIVTTTGDRTDAVLQSSPAISNPTWTSIQTNDVPGYVWTTTVPGATLPQQFFRVVAR